MEHGCLTKKDSGIKLRKFETEMYLYNGKQFKIHDAGANSTSTGSQRPDALPYHPSN